MIRRQNLRWPILALVAAFIAALVLASAACAKGPVSPKDNSSSSGGQETKEKPSSPPPSNNESKPSPPKQESRDDSSRPSSNGSIFGGNSGRSETRDQPSVDSDRSSERKNEGTPTLGGQIQKRSEERDPSYEFHKHYHDSFYYPYDHDFWKRYPYYDRGPVIIIDPSSWPNAHGQWRREYSYRDPLPGSVEEALCDIEATWWERQPEFLMWHIDPDRRVDIYYKGAYSHTVSPREIYKLTVEALDEIRTTEFRFASLERDGFEARAVAKHEFDGPDGKHRTAKLVYYLAKVRDRWIITQIDFSNTNYGSPKCFIATAAYGTEMEDEVLVLRQFRDRYLLTNPLGSKLVGLYYTVSPPIADSIAENEGAKAAVRVFLNPIVQACKVLVGK